MSVTKLDLEQIRDYRACWDSAQVLQVLEHLDRLSVRTRGKLSAQRRRCERKPYSVPVLVSQGRRARLPDGSRFMLHAIGRNLSRSGLGLLVPLFFEPEIPSGDAPMVHSLNVFRDTAVLDIGLRKSCGSTLWLSGSVIRARTMQHEVLDVGVRFNSRISAAEELDFD